MNQELYDFKVKLLDSGIFRHQSRDEYTCTCPYCGDMRRHCYVIIKLTDDTPVMYNCFKCTAKGIVNKKFLSYFNLDDIRLPNCKLSKRLEIQDNVSDASTMKMTTVTENDDINAISDYIFERIGVIPTLQDLQYFQYIANPKKYAEDYLGYCGKKSIFDQRHWFRLTNGAMHGRLDSLYEKESKRRWQRCQTEKVKSAGLYVIKRPFDLYETINVCIAEGIFDTFGLYYHANIPNSIFIAVLGKDYCKGIQHILNTGIFGSDVNIKIFIDPNIHAETVYIPSQLYRVFKRIDIYENATGYDYGVTADHIEIAKCVLKKEY